MGTAPSIRAYPSGLTACSFFLAALANSDRSRLWTEEGDGNGQT